jgi:hypothetical protein
MSESDLAAASVECFAERIASVPAALRLAASVELPVWQGEQPALVVTTGIGASEGPARLLAATLCDGGMRARFVPLMSFALRPPTADLLVVFSQNLSPNARLALTEAHQFKARWLVTSLGLEPGASTRESLLPAMRARGIVPIVVPPAQEDGMLVRIVGPTVASLIAVRLAGALGAAQLRDVPLEAAADAYLAAGVREVFDGSPIALVAAGVSVDSLVVARWKVLETLLGPEPSVWDVLQIAHGPLQAFHPRAQTLVICSVPSATGLVDRLRATLVPERHRVIHAASRFDHVLSYFEHTAVIDACLLATLRHAPRDLFDWPARGGDAPLYDLGDG